MLCEKCRKNEANVHISKNINGRATELHLCEACARESGELLSMNQFLGNFFESVMPLRVRRIAYMPASAPGDNKYAGCEDCVEDLPAYKPEGMTPGIPGGGAIKLAELKAQLGEAVAKEEFERAAELRDEIKKLEGKQGE
jgi:protein arginine kinase activator